jgi:hypothetical protein
MPWVSKDSEVGQVIEVKLLGGAHCKDPVRKPAGPARGRQTKSRWLSWASEDSRRRSQRNEEHRAGMNLLVYLASSKIYRIQVHSTFRPERRGSLL